MARKSKRADLILGKEKRDDLQRIANSRKAPVREVQRANFLLLYSEGTPISDIERTLLVSRSTIYNL